MISRSTFLLALLSLLSGSTATAFVVSPQTTAASVTVSVSPTSSSTLASTLTRGPMRMILPTAYQQQQQKQKYSSAASALSMAPGFELVDPSYNLAIGAFGIGLGMGFGEDLRDGNGEKLLTAKFFGAFAVLFTVFSLFLAFQTTTLRFAFDDDSFSLVQASGAKMQDNVVVGGENRWKYSSFSNYDFLPSKGFPILVYFREDQTPAENREEVPLVIDALEGQVHFFPAISNTKQLEAGFETHNCAHL